MKNIFAILFKRKRISFDKSPEIPIDVELFEHLRGMSRLKRSIIAGLSIVALISFYGLIGIANNMVLERAPVHGGEMTEGIIGVPRFINPALAVTDSDRDLANLVYAGLFATEKGGAYSPRLAEKLDISADGKIYTVTLKSNLIFHDGEPLTSKDVVFTAHLFQNDQLRSPHFANWKGISIEAVDEKTIKFILPVAYSPFIENLTFGVMPAHKWENIQAIEMIFSNQNIEAIGSGPYKVTQAKRKDNGTPSEITLSSWKNYVLGEPYLNKINFKFYQNQDELLSAYQDGKIDSASGLSPEYTKYLEEKEVITTGVLPRIFSVFYNSTESPVLGRPEVRRALELAVNKESLIQTTLFGYGVPLNSPSIRYGEPSNSEPHTKDESMKILEDAGWIKNENGIYTLKQKSGALELKFTLSTSNAGELSKAAEYLIESWTQIGANVTLKKFDIGDLAQNIIKSRKFEALLFGQVLSRYPDPYSYWHSSQRLDPGLNIAGYVDSDADKILEKLRTTTKIKDRLSLEKELSETISSDRAALFLYAPMYTYATRSSIKGIDLSNLNTPSDRFANIHEWYKYDKEVWPMFKN